MVTVGVNVGDAVAVPVRDCVAEKDPDAVNVGVRLGEPERVGVTLAVADI